MDVNDYNTQLSKARSNYAEAQTKLRESYDRDLQATKDVHETRQTKQRKNYEVAKRKMENNHESYVNEYNKNIKDAIADQTDAFKRSLSDERTQFNRDRKDIKEQFDNRLNNLSSTYQQRDREQRAFQEQQLSSAENRYQGNLQNMDRNFKRDLTNTQNHAIDSLRENNLAANREKKKILTTHGEEKRELIKDSRLTQGRIQEKQHKEINNLRNTQETQIKQMKDHLTATVDEIQQGKYREQAGMQANFKEVGEAIVDKNQMSRKRMIKENEQRKLAMEKDFADKIYQIKSEANEKVKGGNKAQIMEDKLKHTVRSYDERIANIHEESKNQTLRDQSEKSRIADNFADSLAAQKMKARKDRDAVQQDFLDFRNDELSKIRDSNRLAVDSLKKELRTNEVRHDDQFIREKNHHAKLLENQRKVFGETVNKLNDSNREAVSEILSANAAEKTRFIEKTRKEHHADMSELKEEHMRVMTAKEKSLLASNDDLRAKNEELIRSYEEKLGRLQKKANKELIRVRELYEHQKEDQQLAMKRLVDAKDREFAVEKTQMKNGFDKRLSNVKREADKSLEQTVMHYEELLGREREESHRKLQQKTSQMRADYERLYQQSELEKVTMRQQFDDKIEEMRISHEEAIEEKQEEKKIGMFNKA
jgi:hypothetical protein